MKGRLSSMTFGMRWNLTHPLSLGQALNSVMRMDVVLSPLAYCGIRVASCNSIHHTSDERI